MIYVIFSAVAVILQTVSFVFCFCTTLYRTLPRYNYSGYLNCFDLIYYTNDYYTLAYFLLTAAILIFNLSLLIFSIINYIRKTKPKTASAVIASVQIILLILNVCFSPYIKYKSKPSVCILNYMILIFNFCVSLLFAVKSVELIVLKNRYANRKKISAEYPTDWRRQENMQFYADEQKSDTPAQKGKKRKKLDVSQEYKNAELIIKYHDLLKNGIITQEDFEKKKKELL